MENSHNILISEDAIKNLTGIAYTTKFKGIQWTGNPTAELPIKMPQGVGFGSEPPITLPQAFFQQKARFGDQVCMQMIKEEDLDRKSQASSDDVSINLTQESQAPPKVNPSFN